jgi:hypothetical protein
MYNLKKTITAFILLLLLATPLVFTVLVLVKQQLVHYQRNEKFNKEILQTIHVSTAEINWVKANKEILYQGKLFDVKSYVINGSLISLTGFFDNKEDKLVKQIVKLVQPKHQSENALNEQTIKFLFFSAFSFNANEINWVARNWFFVTQQFYQFDEMIPTPPYSTPLHPPC